MFFICKIYELCEYNIVMFEQGVLIADRYKLISLLGKGGFSEVWLAEDILTNIRVAIKIYAPGVGLDDAGISLFTQEFSLVFDMNHTNLLHPTHFDCWQRMPFLILPYCQNGSAFKYVSPDVHISEEEAWKVLHDVAAGLVYLHGKKPPIIHQDIKPDNILISDEGHYMITDFGISTRIRSTLKRSAAEMSGGTIAYMGPERFSETPHPIMASDIWSLGAMMYELMTGNPIYGEFGGMLQKKGADIPLIDGAYSKDLKNLIYRCVALETWDRPTAEQIEKETNEYFFGTTEPSNSKQFSIRGFLKNFIHHCIEWICDVPLEELVESKNTTDSGQSKVRISIWGIIGVIFAAFVMVASFFFCGDDTDIEPITDTFDEFLMENIKQEQDTIYCRNYLIEADRLWESVEHMMNPIVYNHDSICLEDSLIPAFTAYSNALIKGGAIDEKYIRTKLRIIEHILEELDNYCVENMMRLENDTESQDVVNQFIKRKEKINSIEY